MISKCFKRPKYRNCCEMLFHLLYSIICSIPQGTVFFEKEMFWGNKFFKMLFRHKQFTKPITFFFEKSEQNNALMFLAKEKSGRNIEFDIFIQRSRCINWFIPPYFHLLRTCYCNYYHWNILKRLNYKFGSLFLGNLLHIRGQ